MSIANLLVPNNYNLYANSITTSGDSTSTFDQINVDTINSYVNTYVNFIRPIHVDTIDTSSSSSIIMNKSLKLSNSPLMDPSSQFSGILQQVNASGSDPGAVTLGGMTFFDQNGNYTIKSDIAHNKIYKNIVNPYIQLCSQAQSFLFTLANNATYYSILSTNWFNDSSSNFTVNTPAANAVSVTYNGPTRRIFLNGSFTVIPNVGVNDDFFIAVFRNPTYNAGTNVLTGTFINGAIVRQTITAPNTENLSISANFTLNTGDTLFFGIQGIAAPANQIVVPISSISLVAMSLGSD